MTAQTPPRTASPARALVAVYALFVLAAGGRAGVQLATRAAEAPLPYALSALSALVYLAGAVVMLRADRDRRFIRAASVLCAIELGGVLIVGTLSLVFRDGFQHATVWSVYGVGYGFVPLALPILGLVWAGRASRYWMSTDRSSNPSER
jgi:hypothetical protein